MLFERLGGDLAESSGAFEGDAALLFDELSRARSFWASLCVIPSFFWNLE